MRPLLLLALLLPSAALAAQPLRAVCTWSGARWEHGATLYLPGTGLQYADADPGDGVTFDGTLGLDDLDLMRFRVHLHGAGLLVSADTAPNEDPIFHLVDQTVALGHAGTLVPDGMVSVVGARHGAVLVSPFHWAADPVKIPDAQGVVACEHLSVHWAAAPDEKAALKAAGFSADLPEKQLPAHRGAVLADGPSGRRVGRIRGQRVPIDLRVAGEKNGWAHVVIPDWTGTVWHGWIKAARLTARTGGLGASGAALGGVLGGAATSPSVPIHTCDQPVPLHARVGGTDMEVGQIAPGTPIHIEGERYGHLAVTFPGGWLHPEEGATFLVSEAVSTCPAGTWKRPPAGDILGSAAK